MKFTFFRTARLYWLLAALCQLPSLMVTAQQENNIWHFGMGYKLDFTTGAPVLGTSNVQVIEGVASVCDGTGSLLFYTSGQTVWDKNGNVMPNGTGLLGNGGGIGGSTPGSASQGVAIVKSVANTSQYYLFTLDAFEEFTFGNNDGRLRYSVIDMSLNGGLGDVVATQKNIVLDSLQSEKMVVIKGTDCNYWLLTHGLMEKQYRAFRIDVNGVSHAPVVSNAGVPNIQPNSLYPGPYICGELKASPDRSKIALVSTVSPFIELADFNAATGIVSNGKMIDSIGNSALYGVEFSPDGSRLYVTNIMPMIPEGLLQYNLALLPNTAAVRASKVVIANGTYQGMRTGPDGKIYVASMSGPAIGCIQNPDLLGTACNFSASHIPYPTAAGIKGGGFGANVVAIPQDTVIHTTSISSCESAVVLNMPTGYQNLVWQDGSTQANFTVTADGRFWCLSRNGCALRIDSFLVQLAGFRVDLGKDTAICNGDILEIVVDVPGAIYNWQDGSTTSSLTIHNPGKYYVTVTKNGCTISDTLDVKARDFRLSLGADTMLCLGKELELVTSLQGSYLWQDNSTDKRFTVAAPGTYRLTVKDGNCIATDSIAVAYENCNCVPLIPNAFTPNHDGTNDLFGPLVACRVVNYSLLIFNRWGQCVFVSNQLNSKWDGKQAGEPSLTGTYFYYIAYWDTNGKPYTYKGDVILIR